MLPRITKLANLPAPLRACAVSAHGIFTHPIATGGRGTCPAALESKSLAPLNSATSARRTHAGLRYSITAVFALATFAAAPVSLGQEWAEPDNGEFKDDAQSKKVGGVTVIRPGRRPNRRPSRPTTTPPTTTNAQDPAPAGNNSGKPGKNNPSQGQTSISQAIQGQNGTVDGNDTQGTTEESVVAGGTIFEDLVTAGTVDIADVHCMLAAYSCGWWSSAASCSTSPVDPCPTNAADYDLCAPVDRIELCEVQAVLDAYSNSNNSSLISVLGRTVQNGRVTVSEEDTLTFQPSDTLGSVFDWEFGLCERTSGRTAQYTFHTPGNYPVRLNIAGQPPRQITVRVQPLATLNADFRVLELVETGPANSTRWATTEQGLVDYDEATNSCRRWSKINPISGNGRQTSTRYMFPPIELGLRVKFDASPSTGQVSLYAWDFGDGTALPGRIAAKAYPNFGSFDIELNAYGSSSISTAYGSVSVVSGIENVAKVQSGYYEASWMAIDGNTVWVNDRDGYLHSIRLDTFSYLSTIPSAVGPIAASNGKVYVADGQKIRSYPGSQLPLNLPANDIAAYGGALFVASRTQGEGLVLLNGQSTSLPRLANGPIRADETAQHVFVSPSHIFLASYVRIGQSFRGVLYVFALPSLTPTGNDPRLLAPVARLDNLFLVQQLYATNSVLAVGSDYGVDLFDIREVDQGRVEALSHIDPQSLEEVEVGQYVQTGLGLYGSDLYLAFGNGIPFRSRVLKMDITNPREPYPLEMTFLADFTGGAVGTPREPIERNGILYWSTDGIAGCLVVAVDPR